MAVIFMNPPRLVYDYVSWGATTPIVDRYFDTSGNPEPTALPQIMGVAYTSSSRYVGSHYFSSYARVWEFIHQVPGPYYYDDVPICETDVTNTTTPVYGPSMNWRKFFDAGLTFGIPVIWDAVGNYQIQLPGAFSTTWTDTAIPVNYAYERDPELYLESSSSIWFFYPTSPSAGSSYSYKIFDGVSSWTTAVALSLIANGENAVNLRVYKGPGTLLYLTYTKIGTTSIAAIRTLDTVTKTLSGVLASVNLGSVSGISYGYRGIAGGKMYTIGTTNYIFAWAGDANGTAVVYKFQTSTPQTITTMSGTGWQQSAAAMVSVEYEPTFEQIRLCYWKHERSSSGDSASVLLTSVDPTLGSWTQVGPNTVVGTPKTSSSITTGGYMQTAISSQNGLGAHTTLMHRTISSSYGGSVPDEHYWRVKTWNDPKDVLAETSADLSESFDVSISPSGSVSIDVEVTLDATITVGSTLYKTSIIYSRWTLAENSYVDGEVLINLDDPFDVTVSATTGGFIEAASVIELSDDTNVEVTADILIIFELTQYYLQMGKTYAEEFNALLTPYREALGLPPYLIYGSDDLSSRKLTTLDVAMVHSENMAHTPKYAHESTEFPSGYQTIAQRVGYVTDLGGSENIRADWGFSFYGFTDGATTVQPGTWHLPTPLEAFTAWQNSPPHWANLTRDWGAAGVTSPVYSAFGTSYGDPDPAFGVTGQYYKYIYQCNVFVPLEETFVELEFGQYWEFNGATISLLEMGWENFAYINARASTDITYSIKVSASHEVSYGVRAAAQHEVPTYYTVARSMEARYEPTVRLATPAFNQSSYAIRMNVVTASHEAPFSLPIQSSHTAEYSETVRVRQSYNAEYSETVRVRKTYDAEYSESPRAVRLFESPYEPFARATAEFIGEYGESTRVVGAFDAPYEPYLLARAAHEASYEGAGRAQASHTADYEAAVQAKVAHEAGYTGLVSARTAHEAPIIYPSPVHTFLEETYEMLARNKVIAWEDSRYSMATEGGAPGDNTVIMTHNGVSHRMDDAYIGSSRGVSTYKFEAAISDISLYQSIKELDQITVNFAGETYSFVVTGRSIDRRSPESLAAVITALSPACLLDLPYSGQVSYTPPETMLMSEIVEAILGQPVVWEVPDWMVPLGRAQIAEATPLQGANSLLNSIAASIQSNPDGSLVARYTYPSNWDLVQSIAPAHTFDDGLDILSVSIGYEYRKGYNKYHLRDSDASYGDTIDWEPDEQNKLTGRAKVTPYPYRSSWKLSTTSEEPLTIEDLGEIVESVSELVEFQGGVGRLSRPIISLTSLTWASTSLGGVSFDAFSTKLTAATTIQEGYGLAKVVYTSKAYQFQVTALNPIESAQLIVKEN